MADPFLGEIRAFGFNFAPVNWAMCLGQLIPLQQNPTLFSIISRALACQGLDAVCALAANGMVAKAEAANSMAARDRIIIRLKFLM